MEVRVEVPLVDLALPRVSAWTAALRALEKAEAPLAAHLEARRRA